MKILLIVILFLSAGLFSYSQSEINKPNKNKTGPAENKIILSVSPNLLYYTPNGTQIAGGIKAQIFVGKGFSLDADFVFSRDYIHFSTSTIGLPLMIIGSIIRNADREGNGIIGEAFGTPLFVVGLMLSFEYFSYHIPIKNNLDISPYLCLFRHKHFYEFDNYSDEDFARDQYCFASGVQINKYFGRFVLSPYAEYNIGYKDHKSGMNIGVYLGIAFQDKKSL